MKHTILMVLVAFLILSVPPALFAEGPGVYDSPFNWQSVPVMAQGGSYAAHAEGYHLLVTNPAFLVRSDSPDFFLHIGADTSLATFEVLANAVSGNLGDDTDNLVNLLGNYQHSALANIATGFMTPNFGVGIFVNGGLNTTTGQTILGLDAELETTVTIPIGLAFSLPQLGPVKIDVGGTLRPWLKFLSRLDASELPTLASGNLETLSDKVTYGYNFSVDLGVLATLDFVDNLTMGLTLRNLGPPTEYKGLSSNEAVEGEYLTPPALRLGVAYNIGTLLPYILEDIAVHGDYEIPFIFSDLEWYTPKSYLQNLRFGSRVSMLAGFIDLWAGLNSGYLSAGLGFDLFIMDINIGFYTVEKGYRLGSKPESHLSLEFSLF